MILMNKRSYVYELIIEFVYKELNINLYNLISAKCATYLKNKKKS